MHALKAFSPCTATLFPQGTTVHGKIILDHLIGQFGDSLLFVPPQHQHKNIHLTFFLFSISGVGSCVDESINNRS